VLAIILLKHPLSDRSAIVIHLSATPVTCIQSLTGFPQQILPPSPEIVETAVMNILVNQKFGLLG
jgi:hypothetical protein